MQSFKCCGRRPSGPAPEPCGKEEIAARIWAVLKQIGEVSASGGGGSLRSSGAWGVFVEGCGEILHWGWQMSYCQIKFEGRLWYWSQIVSGLPVFSCFCLGHCGFWLVVGLLVSKKLQGRAGHLIQGMCWFLIWWKWSRRPLVIGGLMKGLKGGNIPNDANQIVSLKKWLC